MGVQIALRPLHGSNQNSFIDLNMDIIYVFSCQQPKIEQNISKNTIKNITKKINNIKKITQNNGKNKIKKERNNAKENIIEKKEKKLLNCWEENAYIVDAI